MWTNNSASGSAGFSARCAADSNDTREIMNRHAGKVVTNLASAFRLKPPHSQVWVASCPIGVELEVKWQYFFPMLWKKYFVDLEFESLTPEQRASLDVECSTIEQSLVPRLHRSQACGVQRGADRYWEFAFSPCTDIYCTLNQLGVLRHAGLIPSGEHSFQMTIGGLSASRDVYYLLFVLEMLFGSAARIRAGFSKSSSKLSATWACKGRAGLFEKTARDLQFGFHNAVEVRVLTIADLTDVERLLQITSRIADLICAAQDGATSPAYGDWKKLVAQARKVLNDHGLPDVNWNKPSINPRIWESFVDSFDSIRSGVQEPIRSFLTQFEQPSELDWLHAA